MATFNSNIDALVAAPTDYSCHLDITSNITGIALVTTNIDWTRDQLDAQDMHNLSTNPDRIYMPLAGMWCFHWHFRSTNASCSAQGWITHYSSSDVGLRDTFGYTGVRNAEQVVFVNCTDPGNATDQSSEYVVVKAWITAGDLEAGTVAVRAFHMPGASRLAL